MADSPLFSHLLYYQQSLPQKQELGKIMGERRTPKVT
jgi:hypothetical protein